MRLNLTSIHKLKYIFLKRLSQISLLSLVLILFSVICFILMRGFAHINIDLIFGDYTANNPSIMPAIIGTLYLIIISISIAAPIGVGSAIFLSEYGRTDSRLIRYIRLASETLAGIPSIIYGLFGYLFFVVSLGLNYSMIGGGITLSIMILPLIIRASEESLLLVSNSLREGSYALGASKARTIFSVVIPSASSGIFSAIILAIGRVISESAVLILTIGMVVNRVPETLLSPGTSLALDIYYFGSHGYPTQAAATSAVLLGFVFIINSLSTLIYSKLNHGGTCNE